jgi:phosphoenolpyruvate synthase/pyruvate phosphate dikinase
MKISTFGLGSETSGPYSPEELGGKGAGLMYLTSIGVSVPPGFIIPTSVCAEYNKAPKTVMKAIAAAIKPHLSALKEKFGYMPLLSVRSGARASMPGMMDTILNVGLDETTAHGWVARLGTDCVADSRRRLIEMYGSVVKGLDRAKFHGRNGPETLKLYEEATGESFPNASMQLINSIEAVFRSWDNERAVFYRKMNGIPNEWGTAVTVQAMVFGNMNNKSATGVLFTRNPDTGENVVCGEFLPNAQGEDVVAGTRTPLQLTAMAEWNPTVAAELMATVQKLEKDKRDVQDVEFTVENGKLYVLQTRNAKRTSKAAIKIALDMAAEGLILPGQVFVRLSFEDFLNAQASIIDPAFKGKPMGTGIPACSGIATGVVVTTAAAATASKVPCILVTKETTPDDIAGMHAAKGVLTMTGGATSHAAVVARSMNKACVVGMSMDVNLFVPGAVISIDGATGRVWNGIVPVVSGAGDADVARLTKLMVELSGVKGLISNIGAGAVIDLSSVLGDFDRAAQLVLSGIGQHGQVIVDTRIGLGDPSATYSSLFGSQAEEMALTYLGSKLEAMKLDHKVRYVHGCPLPFPSMQSISTVKTVADLMEAKGSEFILDMAEAATPWAQKLISWKEEKDAASVISIGVVGSKGKCYASINQIAQSFLR